MTTSNSRERILMALRANQPVFDNVATRPASYLPVSHVADGDLVARFTTILESLTGKVYPVASADEAIQTVMDILGNDQQVLAWDDLPLPGLVDVLAKRNIKVIVPSTRIDDRSSIQRFADVRVGITGADAGLATTGSLVVVSNAQQGRLPSLLPPVHIALLQRDKLYENLEAWLAAQGHAAIQASRSISLISGPSRTSDIEMQTILGVHGPGKIHVIMLRSSNKS